jgi:hypothetical protein
MVVDNHVCEDDADEELDASDQGSQGDDDERHGDDLGDSEPEEGEWEDVHDEFEALGFASF